MSSRSVLFNAEPCWVAARPAVRAGIAAPIRSWLEEPGSLTARLRAACGRGFGVRLLRQHWDRPYRDESRLLGLAPSRHALVREVMLHCRNRPLVLARSVIPPQALRGVQCRLAHLGTRPLGELLFAYPKISRDSFELARIAPANWSTSLAAQVDGEIWGRRSVYSVATGQILVCECFLPTVLSLSEPEP